MMLAWAWPPDRFVVVVYPLILCLGWRMWRAIADQFPRRAMMVRVGGGLVVALVLAQNAWILADAARTALRIGTVPVMGPQDSWSETSQQMEWIKTQTPTDAIVMANLDPVFYLFTGRKAVRGFQADPYRLFYMPEPGAQPVGNGCRLAESGSEGAGHIHRSRPE